MKVYVIDPEVDIASGVFDSRGGAVDDTFVSSLVVAEFDVSPGQLPTDLRNGDALWHGNKLYEVLYRVTKPQPNGFQNHYLVQQLRYGR